MAAGMERRAWIIHLVCGLLVLLVTAPGLGWRHLWVDEVDTAERARSILHAGYPQVVDAFDHVSLNSGGLELEEGLTHRYIPWLMYYAAAGGLLLGEPLGMTPDTAVRAPSVAAHAVTSTLVSWGLYTFAAVPLSVAAGASLVLGVQAVRMVYARQARYQALLDMFLLMGLVGVAALRRGHQQGKYAVAAAILLMPHAHTLGGSVLSAALGVLLLVQAYGASNRREALLLAVKWAVLPGLVSLVLLVILTRPWLQGAWGALQEPGGSSLSFSAILYPYTFGVMVTAGWTLATRRRDAVAALVTLLFVGLVVTLLDGYSKSNPRYYLSVALLAALWPLTVGAEDIPSSLRRYGLAGMLCILLLPDVLRSISVSGVPWEFQGIRLAWHDAELASLDEKQPLHNAVNIIREHGAATDPVLFDAVPQYGNWYLPGHPIGLLPDVADRTAVNAANPLWERPLVFPVWHVWYPLWGSGTWTCTNRCDFKAELVDAEKPDGPYWLSSRRLGKRQLMCPIGAVATSRLINAPYLILSTGELGKDGPRAELLVVARRCEEAPPP